jgi:hypothetical protein
MDKGWKEINDGAEIRIPSVYRFIIKYITTSLLLFVFVGALCNPQGGDWVAAFQSLSAGSGWPFDNGSIVAQLANTAINTKIAAATSSEELKSLEDKKFYVNMSRFILLAVFILTSYLVYLAHQKRTKLTRQS